MQNMFNVLYDSFKKLAEDPQEPIDLEPLPDLLWNELNMISQARYFSPQFGISATRTAYYETRVLPLANVKGMSLEELERTWRVRMLVYYFQDDLQIHKWIVSQLPPDIPNSQKFRDCLVFLNKELSFAQRCYDEIIERIRSNPIALHTHGLVEMEQLSPKVHTKSFKHLLREILKNTKRIFPDETDRESLINEALGERYAQLRDMPFYKRISQFQNTQLAVKRDLIDYRREQRRQSTYPKGGLVSLDILTPEHKSLQIPQQEELPSEADPNDALVADIKNTLGDAVAKTAEVYFEIYFKQDNSGKKQDEPGKKVKQQQVVKACGKNRKTTRRHIKKIDKFLLERMKKN